MSGSYPWSIAKVLGAIPTQTGKSYSTKIPKTTVNVLRSRAMKTSSPTALLREAMTAPGGT